MRKPGKAGRVRQRLKSRLSPFGPLQLPGCCPLDPGDRDEQKGENNSKSQEKGMGEPP